MKSLAEVALDLVGEIVWDGGGVWYVGSRRGDAGYPLAGWEPPSGAWRTWVASALLDALREAALPPEPSPVSAGRLGHIRSLSLAGAPCMTWDDVRVAFGHLFDHTDHLERLTLHLMQDEPGQVVREAYRRGFAAGAEAQHKACRDAAWAAGDAVPAYVVRQSVYDASLVTPD